MKRCPQCHRVETDEALKFCRVDGATLVSDSGVVTAGSGTVKFDSAQSTEIETSILPHTTAENINRATAPTTVLPSPQATSTTSELSKPKRRMTAIVIAVILTALVAALTAVLVDSYRARTSSAAAIQSIAVMPFVNESGNADVEYLSDGMTETLISSLSQLPNLNVKARSTVFRYKGKTTDAKFIGKELNVQAVLNGRVMQRGNQLTLSLELVNPDTENVIWSEQYNRNQTDLVNLQSEIARDVSSKLRSKLSGADQQKLAKTYTTDPEAYRLYLQGRFYLNKRAGTLFERAQGYFQQAIEKDPNFALGYVGLAEFAGQRDRLKAKEYITRALALDNQLAEAHANLGYQYMLEYNWVESERELKRAIELNQNYAQAYQWNGSRLAMLGLYNESLASYDRAISIEPTLADIRNNRASCLVAAGRVDEGIAELKQSMQLDPTFAWSHSHISYLYRMKGDHVASVEERARAFDLLDMPENAKRLRETFATSGWTAYLRELLRQDWGRLGNSQTRRASLLAELGEKEEAFTHLNTAAEKGDFWLFSIKYDPAFNDMRGDSRFKELLKKFDPPR